MSVHESHPPFHRVLETLGDRVVKRSESTAQSRCPAHDDKSPSLSVSAGDDGRVLLCCHAGCTIEDVCRALGMDTRDLFPRPNAKRTIVETYDYKHGDGKLLFQSVRYDPKDFRQRRPDDNGGWIWDLNGASLVPYRLPELTSADPAESVFIVEGERDVETLRDLGLLATCNPMGAGKWREDFNEHLRDRAVVVCEDNDSAGHDHARNVAEQLHGTAKSVRIVTLPNLDHHGDVTDWIREQRAAGKADPDIKLELHRLSDEAPEWQTNRVVRERPSIVINNRQLDDVTRQAWESIVAYNDPPTVFRFGGCPARLDATDTGEVLPLPLRKDEACEMMARSADWIRETEEGPRDTFPSMRVVANILATPDPPLPVLERIVSAPIIAPDGRVRTEPGYDPAARVVVATRGLKVPNVSEDPTDEEISRARELLHDELVGDFPFVDEASRAHAVALVLLPFVRSTIDGSTPFHIVDASAPGTGKSLLVATATAITNGRPTSAMSGAQTEEEWRKRVTAGLRDGSSHFCLDNLRSTLDSAALAAALTAETWSDRLLGVSTIVRLPIRCTWVVTGNNVATSEEIARRSILIRMDAGVEKPWLRPKDSFRHPLPNWAIRNRGRIIWACLTLARAWFAAGCPDAKTCSLGSFDEWSRVMGGILECSGIEGFLGNLNELYERVDNEGAVWRAFLGRWWLRFETERVGVADLLYMVSCSEIPVDIAGDSEHARKVSLGAALAKHRGRVFIVPVSSHETLPVRILAAAKHGGSTSWRLERPAASGWVSEGLGESVSAPDANSNGQPAETPGTNNRSDRGKTHQDSPRPTRGGDGMVGDFEEEIL